ncbi:MAG: DUF3088 family protein [Planctomycetia bacterium]
MADKPILFLLKSGFLDPQHGPGGFYCPECATIAGLLWYYPDVAAKLDVRLVDAPRPRPDVVALVGEETQSCPVLVLAATCIAPAARRTRRVSAAAAAAMIGMLH